MNEKEENKKTLVNFENELKMREQKSSLSRLNIVYFNVGWSIGDFCSMHEREDDSTSFIYVAFSAVTGVT